MNHVLKSLFKTLPSLSHHKSFNSFVSSYSQIVAASLNPFERIFSTISYGENAVNTGYVIQNSKSQKDAPPLL